MDASNYARTISRKFLLDPGYYEIDYSYAQRETTSLNATYCASGQNALTTAWQNAGSPVFTLSAFGQSGNQFSDSLAVYVDADLSVSHPQNTINPANGLPYFYGQVQYFNPDGSLASLPSAQPVNGYLVSNYTVGPDGKSLPYLPRQSSMVDACFYSTNPVARKVPILITKPGYYWISFSAGDGTPNSFYMNAGAELADVAFYALGGLSTQLSGGQIQGTDGTYRTPVPVQAPAPVASVNTESVITSSSSWSGYALAFSGTMLGFDIPAQ